MSSLHVKTKDNVKITSRSIKLPGTWLLYQHQCPTSCKISFAMSAFQSFQHMLSSASSTNVDHFGVEEIDKICPGQFLTEVLTRQK